MQFVFPLILLVIASSSGIHHYLQTLVVMSIFHLCSLKRIAGCCICILNTLMYIVMGGIYSDLDSTAGWQREERQLSSSLFWLPALLMSSSRVALSDLIRSHLCGSNFAFTAYISLSKSLKADRDLENWGFRISLYHEKVWVKGAF